MASKVVVTGGAGFIGSHLVEKLVEKNFNVTVIDNLFAGKKENLKNVWKDIEFVKGNILDSKLLNSCFKDADFVFHEAALRSVRVSVKKPVTYASVNILGTIKVLEAAKQQNVKRVIYASSSSIYGNQKIFPVKEHFLPNPQNPYAASKACAEQYCKMYSQLFGLETIALRYFNVYGPRQDYLSEYGTIFPIFVNQLLHNKSPTIFGDGKQARDFTYVADVVEANWKAMRASKKAVGESFNVCNGKTVSVNQVFSLISKALGKTIQPNYVSVRAGEVQKTHGEPSKARKLLGLQCKMSFQKGLPKTVEWLKKEFFARDFR
ncbi:MAG: SDR family oxidoreductase [Candidatus Diapherotrites archaeon]|nr:SDR family oxidoreductase [Candidatus Diapherotrites archaeon]